MLGVEVLTWVCRREEDEGECVSAGRSTARVRLIESRMLRPAYKAEIGDSPSPPLTLFSHCTGCCSMRPQHRRHDLPTLRSAVRTPRPQTRHKGFSDPRHRQHTLHSKAFDSRHHKHHCLDRNQHTTVRAHQNRQPDGALRVRFSPVETRYIYQQAAKALNQQDISVHTYCRKYHRHPPASFTGMAWHQRHDHGMTAAHSNLQDTSLTYQRKRP
jgi:hypothetical protein